MLWVLHDMVKRVYNGWQIGESVQHQNSLSNGSVDSLLMHCISDRRKFLADRISFTSNGFRFSFGSDGRRKLHSTEIYGREEE